MEYLYNEKFSPIIFVNFWGTVHTGKAFSLIFLLFQLSKWAKLLATFQDKTTNNVLSLTEIIWNGLQSIIIINTQTVPSLENRKPFITSWILFTRPQVVFDSFLTFWSDKMNQAHLVYFLPQTVTRAFHQKALLLFMLEIKLQPEWIGYCL